MYRLTTPEGECLALNSYGVECVCTPDENCDEGCLNQRIARLAQYEDTGLTPEQVMSIKKRQVAHEWTRRNYDGERISFPGIQA